MWSIVTILCLLEGLSVLENLPHQPDWYSILYDDISNSVLRVQLFIIQAERADGDPSQNDHTRESDKLVAY